MQLLTAKQEWNDSLAAPSIMEQLKPLAKAL
jgi:hypothetical protein